MSPWRLASASISGRFLVKFAAGDDVAVDLGGDLLDDLDVVVRRGANRDGGRDEYYKPTKHN